jgi:DNA integrity scanning protein DisA with diadenylate cyclase activity
VGQRHEAEQIMQSGTRMAARATAERQMAGEMHRQANRTAGEAADRVAEVSELLRAITAAHRAELEQAHGSEQGPH